MLGGTVPVTTPHTLWGRIVEFLNVPSAIIDLQILTQTNPRNNDKGMKDGL